MKHSMRCDVNADWWGVARRHVMHRHLVFIPEPEVSMQPLGEQTSFFLQAVCIRCAVTLQTISQIFPYLRL